MSIDYLTCANCGENFCDCGDFVSCECGKVWCCYECAESDGFIEDEENLDEYDEPTRSCNFCRNQDFEDCDLLELAMKLLQCDREFLINKMNESEGE